MVASRPAAESTGFDTPDNTAFTCRPARTPPPTRSITSRSVSPGSTSANPACITSPTTVQINGPGVSRVPSVRYHSAPRVTISGTLASVSTFVTSVGFDPTRAASSTSTAPEPADQPSCGVIAYKPCTYGGSQRGIG